MVVALGSTILATVIIVHSHCITRRGSGVQKDTKRHIEDWGRKISRKKTVYPRFNGDVNSERVTAFIYLG